MTGIKVVTLFSGYDSQCLALQRLSSARQDFSFELVAWSEIDKYAIQAHNALFPQWADRNLGDVSKIDWKNVPDFDLLTYSSPCQDFSVAGLQKGGEKGSGTRSSLLWECEKVIREKRPKYCILENVKALVSKKFKGLFDNWCDILESYGYTNYWQVLNAKDYGVPQNRERVFLVSMYEDCGYGFPCPFTLKSRLKDVLEEKVDEKQYLNSKQIQARISHCERKQKEGCGFKFEPANGDGIAHSITTRAGQRETDNYIIEQCKCLDNLNENSRQEDNGVHQFNFPLPFTLKSRLKDVLEDSVDQKYYLKKEMQDRFVSMPEKGGSDTSTNVQGMLAHSGFDSANRDYGIAGVAPTIARDNHTPKVILAGELDVPGWHDIAKRIVDVDGLARCVCTQSNNSIQKILEPKTICLNSKVNGKQPSLQDRVYDSGGVSTAITTGFMPSIAEPKIKTVGYVNDGKHQQDFVQSYDGICRIIPAGTHASTCHLLKTQLSDYKIRKLTPKECFRLMGVSDDDIKKIQDAGISNSQQYKLAGNSIVVDVLYYIFYSLFFHKEVFSNDEDDSGNGNIERLGYYHKIKHNASSVVSADGIAPTVMECHGTVTAIVEAGSLNTKYRSDGQGLGTQGISPTIRSEMHGHAPLILEHEREQVSHRSVTFEAKIRPGSLLKCINFIIKR